MKKIFIAIIAEYNPLHNGHLYQIRKARRLYPNANIIVIMSGNFTQRCEPAIISKWARTKQAIASGADCVVELPTLFSTAPAEIFATAGVYIADCLGVVDVLLFSAEDDNLSSLKELADLSENKKVLVNIKRYLAEGKNFPTSLQKAVEDYSDNHKAEQLKKPNNILAIEYIKALSRISSDITPCVIKRRSTDHNSMITSDSFASAFFIRDRILNGDIKAVESFMPDKAFKILLEEVNKNKAPTDLRNLQRLIFFKLNTMSQKELAEIAYVNEGLENRIKDYAEKADNLCDLLDSIKTKRYTYSRVKRIVLYSILGITKDMQKILPTYVRILGVKKDKTDIIGEIRKKSMLPVVFSGKEILSLGNTANIIFDTERKSAVLYSLATDKINSNATKQEFEEPFIKI